MFEKMVWCSCTVVKEVSRCPTFGIQRDSCAQPQIGKEFEMMAPPRAAPSS